MGRTKLEQTVLGPVDLKDQPDLPYIFLIDTSAGGRQAFTVDVFGFKDGVVSGHRGEDIVIAVPVAASWTVLHRDLVLYRTVEESIRKHYTDGKTEFDLGQTLQGVPGGPTPPPPPSSPSSPTQGYDDSGLYR